MGKTTHRKGGKSMNIKSLRLLAGAFLLGVALLAAGQLGTGQTVKAAEPQDVYGTARYDYAFQYWRL